MNDNDAQNCTAHYLAMAEAALRPYALGPTELDFIAHNAGVVFRVNSREAERSYLLKLHVRVGEGENPSAARLEMGMRWLAGIARDTAITVQTPVPTSAGSFVSTIAGEHTPIHCTVQHWLEGSLPNGPLSVAQMGQAGRLMAQLHRYSRLTPVPSDGTVEHGAAALSEHVALLRATLPQAIFPQSSYLIVQQAQQKIQQVLARLGISRDVWGPVHGDLHYDNLLFSTADVHPIDFSELRLAHYLYDIGVTLYHTLHEGVAARQAFLQGYQQLGPLYREHLAYLDAFVTYAAIDNIAWNATLPAQVPSALFQKNLEQLVFTFCRGVVEGNSFL